jgi:hypothetical protein
MKRNVDRFCRAHAQLQNNQRCRQETRRIECWKRHCELDRCRCPSVAHTSQLAHFQLTEVPKELFDFRLSCVTTLNMSYNLRLTLPSEIGCMTTLKELSVRLRLHRREAIVR